MKINLNQKLINLIEHYNLVNANFLLSNKPLKRTIQDIAHISADTKLAKLTEQTLDKNCIKASKISHHFRKSMFAGMTKGSMPKIMG